MHQASAGNAEAFGTLVRRHQRRIFGLAVRLLGDEAEAEDLTQETFVRAYQALGEFPEDMEPSSFLYRIAVNLSLRNLADEPREPPFQPGRPGWPTYEDPRTELEDRELSLAISEALEELPPLERTALVLVCMEGLPPETAGEVLGCTQDTLAWRVQEGRRRLRELLALQGFSDGAKGFG